MIKGIRITILVLAAEVILVTPVFAAGPSTSSNSSATSSFSDWISNGCWQSLPVLSWFFSGQEKCSIEMELGATSLAEGVSAVFQSVTSLMTRQNSQVAVLSPPPLPSSVVTSTPFPSLSPPVDLSPPTASSVFVQPLTAGSGISITGTEISNTGILSLAAGSGVSVDGNTITNTDTGGSQSIFKNIAVNGQNTISASQNSDTLTLQAGNGINLMTNADDKNVTISSTFSPGAGGGWNPTSSLVALQTLSDNVAIGTTTALGTFSVVGSSNQSQLVVRGAGSQTAKLLDLQNSSGSSMASFAANGSLTLATNSVITLSSYNPVGTVSRLLTLRSTNKYDRPWISNVDYDGRHVVAFGILNTNNDDTIHKRWEFKTVADSGGSMPQELLTRLAIDYDTDLANVIFGRINTIGVHNAYGEPISFVHQMRSQDDSASYQLGDWRTELGAGDSTVMTLDPKTYDNTKDTTFRMFRETNTTGQRRFVIMKGDGTVTETFIINADTGAFTVKNNGEGAFFGDGTNVGAYANFQSNRTMVGYDGSYAVLQGGTSKGVKLNVGSSSFGVGTALTILPTGEVGIGTVSPAGFFSVGSGSPFQVTSGGAVSAATGLTSSGTITFSGLNTAGGVVYTGSGGVLASLAGAAGQCLVSNGSSAPSWGTCGSGGGAGVWTISSGTVQPINSTVDFLVGGTSTAAAKFAVLNVNSGTPVASISGLLTVNNSAARIQGTQYRTLNIGGNMTGTISLQPNNSNGRVGINTTLPMSELDIVNSSSPEFRLSKTADTYFKIENKSSFGTQLADVAVSGEALLDFDPVTTDGVSKSSVRLFRNVTTSDTGTGFTIYLADGSSTVQSFFGAKTNSYFNVAAGNFGVGTSSPLAKLDVEGSASMSGVLSFRGTTDPKIDVLNGEHFGVRTSPGGTAGVSERLTILNRGFVGIGSTNPSHLIELSGGAYSDGATWENASDQNLKMDFEVVEPEVILAKIDELPVTEWSYISQGPGVRHVGPVAQDFYRIFGLGSGDKAISTIDPAGIALVGIKGLNRKLDALSLIVQQQGQVAGASQTISSTPSPSPSVDSAADGEVDSLSVLEQLETRGSLLAWGKTLFKESAVFENLVSFVSNVVFKGRVQFERAPEFGADTAGVAVIKQGADKVEVKFGAAYDRAPQVAATLSVATQADAGQQEQLERAVFDGEVRYLVTNVSGSGFVIKLSKPAPADLEFSWVAVSVAEPKRFVGNEVKEVGEPAADAVAVDAAETMSAAPDASPSPVVLSKPLPSASAIPVGEPAGLPSPVPSVSVSSSPAASPASGSAGGL